MRESPSHRGKKPCKTYFYVPVLIDWEEGWSNLKTLKKVIIKAIKPISFIKHIYWNKDFLNGIRGGDFEFFASKKVHLYHFYYHLN